MNLLGVSGSMREASYGARALSISLESAEAHNTETRLLDIRKTSLPLYNPDARSHPHPDADVLAAVNWADAFILASPDYHGSIGGALKNFLDYHWHEFAGKLFAYIVASDEKGLTVMDQMRTIVRQCYGWSLPYGVSVHGRQDFDAQGVPHAPAAHRLAMLGRDTAVYGAILREQFLRDRDGQSADSFAARYRKHA